MNRFEYMRRLEDLLSDISPSEKEEALTYYNDYFNDAGQENEQQVIEELGSPEQVAAGVKEGLGLQTYDRVQDSPEGGKNQNQSAQIGTDGNAGAQNTGSQNAFSQNSQIPPQPQQKKSKPAWEIALIVIGLIFASPLILALICVIFALIISVFSLIFGLLIGFGAAALALYVTAFVCALLGLVVLPVNVLVSGALLGSGCLCAAAGILCMVLTVLVAMTVPAACKGTAWLWRKMFRKA
ncbi:MAG: DUF1700 domain-containing protein [Lachnospiraceae bacterium]|nr:DUF1700 domain-containing protein [Lachnospiraceae bacterium]